MTTYRTGSSWGTTIVREGALPVDSSGYRRDDDELVAVVTNKDADLAALICELLNGRAQIIKCLEMAYCPDCDLRMMRGSRHPHPLTPVQVTVTEDRGQAPA